VQVFPEQSQAAPVATVLLTLQTHEKKKEKTIHKIWLVRFVNTFNIAITNTFITKLIICASISRTITSFSSCNRITYTTSSRKKKEKNNTQNLVSYIKGYL
jgi:hypothetical protein